jgi:hypothetical protein
MLKERAPLCKLVWLPQQLILCWRRRDIGAVIVAPQPC